MSAPPTARKYPGTGMRDTPLETWAALFQDYMAGEEPLTDVVRRHGVLYSAAVERARQEAWATLRTMLQAPTPELIRSWQKHSAARAHDRLERGSGYLASALAAAPPPDPWQPGDTGPAELEEWRPPAVDVQDDVVVDLATYRERGPRVLH